MNEKLQYLKGILFAALFIAVSFGVIWLTQQFQPGLSMIMVDGTEADILDGNAALEAALGEHFAVRGEDGSLPSDKDENKVKLSCMADVPMLEGVSVRAYAADDISSITYFNGASADMSLEEYKEVFGDSIRIYGYGEILCAEVLEMDGRQLSAERIEADMKKYNITEGGAPFYVYMRDILNGDAESFIMLQCWFEDGECMLCSFQSMQAA